MSEEISLYDLSCIDVLEHLGIEVSASGRSNCPWDPDSDSQSFVCQGPLWYYHAAPSDEERKGNVLQLALKMTGSKEDAKELLKTVAAKLGIKVTPPAGPSTTPGQPTQPARQIKDTYNYLNAQGKLVLQVVRYDPKSFAQCSPDGNGGRIWSVKGIEAPLYNLRRILKASSVIITEGEKDVRTLGRLKIAATTNVGGAGKWKPSYNEVLRGKRVAILPDNDPPGAAHARLVANNLLGIAAMVKIVLLPGLPPKGDVSDWVAAGHTQQDLLALIQAAQEITEPIPDVTSSDHEQASTPTLPTMQTGNTSKTALSNVPSLEFTSASAISMETYPPINWIVEGILVEGLCVLFSVEKAGKSHMCLAVGVEVARGGKVFSKIPVQKRGVLYLALEDTKRRLQQRLLNYCDGKPENVPSNLHLVSCTPDVRTVNTGLIEQLTRILDTNPDIQFCIIDTLQKVLGSGTRNADAYQTSYEIVSKLHTFANQRKICVLLIHHEKKGAETGDTFESVSGSRGLLAVADVSLRLQRQRFSNGEGVLSVTGRDVEETQYNMVFDTATCKWSMTGVANDGCKTKERQEIRDIIVELGGEARPVEIQGALESRGRKKSAAAISYLLRRMYENDEVQKLGNSYAATKYDPTMDPSNFTEVEASNTIFDDIPTSTTTTTTATATTPNIKPEPVELGYEPLWTDDDVTPTTTTTTTALPPVPTTGTTGNTTPAPALDAAIQEGLLIDAEELFPDDPPDPPQPVRAKIETRKGVTTTGERK